jgi:CRISPR system Cascade subunit CasB
LKPSARDHRFIAYLERLATDAQRRHGTHRGALADLAAELGKQPGSSVRSVRWLARWTAHVSQSERARHHLVAALFAAHPASTPAGNLGLTMARIALARGVTASLEQRFVALLEADAEDVGHHLRGLVGLARAADVPLDWAQLLADLRRWEDPLRQVQTKWALGFWASEASHSEPEAAGVCRDTADSQSEVAVPQSAADA